MQNLRENFDSIDDARTRTAEISSCVSGPYIAALDGGEIAPTFRQTRARQLAQDVFFVIAAGNKDDHFRSVAANRFGRGSHAALPYPPKRVIASGNCDLFWNPVTRSESRLEPFEHQCSWAADCFAGQRADSIESRLQIVN